ncbi:YdeI/OmpD-associated family protein [Isoptericola sp. NPDC057391]|uniref:YdeI/OmpD-associated family protein n=1 Tax=Isoptericola sp. NPDC057391 TaxID=3346117 RepID=UPI00363E2432
MSEAPTVQTFTTTLLATGGNTVGLPVPDDVVAAFGRGRRVPVVVTVDGYTYPATVSPVGGRFLVPFNAETRTATAAWEKLSPSRQKAHALSVDGAKSDETRDRRVARVLESLVG